MRGLRKRLGDVKTMKVLFDAAEAEAMKAGEQMPAAEHLFLAALQLSEDRSAVRALEACGVDAGAVRNAIEAVHADAAGSVGVDVGVAIEIPGPVPPRGVLRTTPSTQRMFREVVDHIKRDRSQMFGAYFVLVAAETGRGTVSRALDHLRIDREVLAQAARVEISA